MAVRPPSALLLLREYPTWQAGSGVQDLCRRQQCLWAFSPLLRNIRCSGCPGRSHLGDPPPAACKFSLTALWGQLGAGCLCFSPSSCLGRMFPEGGEHPPPPRYGSQAGRRQEQILSAVTPLWMLWCHCSVGAGCYGAPKGWV